MYIFILPAALGLIALLIRWWILRKRKKTTRRQYELKSAAYLKSKGYTHIRIGKGTKDGGRDLSARKNGQLHLCQCKMFSQKKVGVKDVRELFGVAQAQNAKAIFITTR
ncbi:MAG: restriction endonuclease [Saprospiraceae bacterium]